MQGLPFILDTAASHKSVGAVLLEVQDEKELVIAYISKLMNKQEESYCVTRKELAIQVIKLHEHFIPIVNGQGVLQGADNAAVSCIRNLKKPTGQTARWLDEFDTYNITIL